MSQNIFEYQVSEDKLFQGRWIQFVYVHVFHGNHVEDWDPPVWAGLLFPQCEFWGANSSH